MTKKISGQELILKEIINDLTEDLNEIRSNVLKRSSKILSREINILSLHGMIGGKNNTYVDSVRTQFLDFNDFFSKWLKGLNDKFETDKKKYLIYHSEIDWDEMGSFRNIRLLQDEKIFLYAKKFLERNFYKHMDQRIRIKPGEHLWSLWFGYKLTYGLLIAPIFRNNEWTINKSEIRRANFNYWTIGHVMNTGLIDPSLDSPIMFNNLKDLYKFYQGILKRLSDSVYEQGICDLYIDYLKCSADVLNEPFLIPEFRYAGLIKDHEHRLDFTIFNQHTLEFIGFEISPASTHMNVKNLKEKQNKVNEELKKSWEKEMDKRNKYFKTFGITTMTFTDKDLVNLDKCFDSMKEKLSERSESKIHLDDQISRLREYK